MTVNMSAFEDLRKRILSANQEELISLKAEIDEHLKQRKYAARCGEDATGAWFLFLDVMCDLRLGACNWSTPTDDIRLVSDGTAYDMMLDWYELLATVARSVNQRQDDGRGGCNKKKLSELREFRNAHSADVERLIAGGIRYCAYLEEWTQRVFHMESAGNWSTLPKIDAMRWEYL